LGVPAGSAGVPVEPAAVPVAAEPAGVPAVPAAASVEPASAPAEPMTALHEAAAAGEAVSVRTPLPKLDLNCPVTFTDGTTCKIGGVEGSAFALYDVRGRFTLEDQFTFYTSSRIKVVLQYSKQRTPDGKGSLFGIVNFDELSKEGLLGQMLEDLSNVSLCDVPLLTRRERYA
jgi:hypothetical protein